MKKIIVLAGLLVFLGNTGFAGILTNEDFAWIQAKKDALYAKNMTIQDEYQLKKQNLYSQYEGKFNKVRRVSSLLEMLPALDDDNSLTENQKNRMANKIDTLLSDL